MKILLGLATAGLLFLAVPLAAAAPAEARVRVDGNANLLQVAAEIGADVDRSMAWNVLTDYNHWSEFVPDLLVSRIVSRPGEPLRLEQRGRVASLPNLPLVMIVAVEEHPPSTIRLRRVAGNVRDLMGEWQIQGKGPVRLLYRAVLEPGMPIPPRMSLDIFRNEAKTRLEAMAREMERRAGVKPQTAPREGPSPRGDDP
ncbi:MAG TPA: SRPBCC family protein [Thiobacillaceae bacterium]|nr:SRPBCC family protein [Thiobacillaceae bacterium]HNU65184.1 SRPBCC family protein [Thiobacillaceae bacterium]